MTRDGRRLAESCNEVGVDVVDLDRREAETVETVDGAGLSNEPRQPGESASIRKERSSRARA
jgi:hypothetical protein